MEIPNHANISRRDFLKLSGAAITGLAYWTLPPWLHAAARMAGGKSKTLVVIFQRGAADGLNILIPFNDPLYQKARPTIGLNYLGGGVLDLNGSFGLHPSMAPLLPLWQSGQLAFVHAAGSPNNTRSHFDAQDNMESGTPFEKGTSDGWLNRSLSCMPSPGTDPLCAIALSARQPRILRGKFPVTSIEDLKTYGFAHGPSDPNALEAMYDDSSNGLLAQAGKQTFETVRRVQDLLKTGPAPSDKAGYSYGDFNRSLSDLARILKSGANVKAAFLDIGGWDHHNNEYYRLEYLLREWSLGLSAFWRDLGDKAADVVLVSMTEFGRTVAENGSRGTDHGRGGVMFLMGGPVKGGKVYGKWPGLETENLEDGRDLKVTTDFRQVLSEALAGHLGIKRQASVFPGFKPGPALGWI